MFFTWIFSLKQSEIDYKVLYENECKEKDKLIRNMARIRKDYQESQEQIRNLQNSSVISKNNKISQVDYLFAPGIKSIFSLFSSETIWFFIRQ